MKSRSRQFLLCAVSVSLSLTAVRWAIAPANRSYTPTTFAERLEMPGWRFKDQNPLVDQSHESSRYDQLLAGRVYNYSQGRIQLQIELRDVFTTTGDVNEFLKSQLSINPDLLEVEDVLSDSGYYRLFTFKNQTYLSSCININGQATVTPEQFRRNRYRYDWQGDRVFRWVTGRTSLLEQRCLWVLISTPANSANPSASEIILQQAWQEYHEAIVSNS